MINLRPLYYYTVVPCLVDKHLRSDNLDICVIPEEDVGRSGVEQVVPDGRYHCLHLL